jgi:hypothetical protein
MADSSNPLPEAEVAITPESPDRAREKRDGSSDAQAPSEPDYRQVELLAIQGDAQAQYELGKRWEHGEGVPQDFRKAADWYQKSAAEGNPEAQVALGGLYEHGRGVQTDSRIALKWYLKAAGQAFPGARLLYESLDAKEGRASAQFSMGRRFEEGDGVCQNLADAAHWYLLAAEQGYSSAQFRLGTMCGLGVVRNIENALHWLSLAAQAGDMRAEYAVGQLYEADDRIRDHVAAVNWYRRAAVKGYKDAQGRLAQMFAQGLGVRQSAEEASKWQVLADQRTAIESDPYGGTDENWHGNPGWGGHR